MSTQSLLGIQYQKHSKPKYCGSHGNAKRCDHLTDPKTDWHTSRLDFRVLVAVPEPTRRLFTRGMLMKTDVLIYVRISQE